MASTINAEIGQRVALLRKKKKLSQTELAQSFSTSRATVGHWETGFVTLTADVIIQLSTIFKTSSDYILGITPEVKENPQVLYVPVVKKSVKVVKTLDLSNPELQALLVHIKEYNSNTRKHGAKLPIEFEKAIVIMKGLGATTKEICKTLDIGHGTCGRLS